jgi:acyl-CoA thioesterase II
VHSLHSYFLRPGDPSVPILYEVDRIRDGRSFTTRRVVAIQHGRAIFNLQASFHVDEPGFDHQADMPDVPEPESLPSRSELRAANPELFPAHWPDRPQPIDIRYVTDLPYRYAPGRRPEQLVWMRANGTMPDDQVKHTCLLAYLSDMTLLDTCALPHISPYRDDVMGASLDHLMWFHRSFRADEWMLYVMDSPSASGARGFNRGQVFARDATLIASVAQEGLMRVRTH